MLTAGTHLGPFDILAPLGAGGMGEVYRARDTRLNRTVALKLLSPLKAGPEFRQRFVQEARAIAALNHPHICTLHDVRQESGLDILVMEYCEGATLAAQLAKGPLTIEQVVGYAIEIAQALDHAHRHGLTHRDLKPGNIMLTPSGTKLLDFGLAKLSEVEEADTSASTATEAVDVTTTGAVLGTRPYMAPEQLESKAVDARADVFAFGAVLYEMVTGRRAFSGASHLAVIAAILSTDPPPVSTLQPSAPPALARVIKHCLAKNPEDRWSSMHDVLLELRGIGEDLAEARDADEREPARRRAIVAAVLAALVTLAALGTWLVWRARPEAPEPMRTRFSMFAPQTAAWAPFDGIIVSPDGLRFAFVASLPDGKPLLWIRLLDALSAQPLSGTEGASHPFWSPDGRFLGFFADGKLKTIEVSGGAPRIVCDAPLGRSGSWSRRGAIVFARSSRDSLYAVAAAGGVPTKLTSVDTANGDWAHRSPHFLPDGQHFLYVVRSTQRDRQGVFIGGLDGYRSGRVLSVDSSPAYAEPGYLLYVEDDTLLARPFDAVTLQVTGDPMSVAHPVGYDVSTGRAYFSVSENGILTYRGYGTPDMQLAWFDRNGNRQGTVGPPGQYWDLSLAPDEKRIAVTRMDPLLGTRDIWVIDRVRGTASQLTFDPGNDLLPIWSPDSTQIVFNATRGNRGFLFRKPSSGAGPEEPLFESTSEMFPTDWSNDRASIVFSRIDPALNQRSDLWVYSFAAGGSRALVATSFRETHARFSPDHRWIAYSSDESGRAEVYVQSFPAPGLRTQITTAGGAYPTWRRDGRELFYVDPQGSLCSVDIESTMPFRVGAPRMLFQTGIGQLSASGAGADYAFTGDGQRVLLKTPLQSADASPISVVLNWTSGLKQ